MKKKRYSLTAKQRKELNSKNEGGTVKNKEKLIEPALDEFTDAEGADLQGETVVKKDKRKTHIIIISIFMVVLFLTGIAVTILLIDEMSKPVGNPTATISLSNGKKLKFELFMDDAPIAVTNFMFLSLQGFYDGTVIHDNQNNWVRFMGVRTSNDEFAQYDIKNHIGYSKLEDSSYYTSFKGLNTWKEKRAQDRNVFWYRLRRDADSMDFQKQASNEGLLCFMYNYSSCLFQISCVDNPQMSIGSTDYKNFTVMGKYADASTLQAIRDLNNLETTQNGVWFNPNEVIKITSIKIANYDKSAWTGRDGILENFDTHMEEINGYDSYASETYNYNRIRS